MANYVTLLQTYCTEHSLQLPVYSTERADSSGDGYTSSVQVCGARHDSEVIHSSKKLAEEDAARVAYKSLQRASEPTSRSRASARLASRSAARPANRANGSAAADYSRKLELLCNAQGLPPPEYVVRESDGSKFSATVTIGGDEYLSNDSESYSRAKDHASLIALAEVGLSLLNINGREDGTEDNLERSVPVSSRSDASQLPPHSANSHTAELPERNYKAIVNEYCQKNYLSLPEYVTEYPEDSTGFVAVLNVAGKEYRSKPMPTKKKAEQDAAGRAAVDIGLVTLGNGEGQSASAGVESFTPVSGSVGGLTSRFVNGESSAAPPSYSSSVGGTGASLHENITSNYKGMLQEHLARQGLSNPQYSMSQGTGGRFVSTVTLTNAVSREVMHFQGKGYADKKTAEQSAAKQACIHYNLE